MADQPIDLKDLQQLGGQTSSQNSGPSSTAGQTSSSAKSASKADELASTFDNIFSQTKKPEKDSKMVKSILVQKEALEKMKPILGNAPDLGKTLEVEREYRLKRKMRLLQSAFAGVVVVALGMAFFFYTQLSPQFTLFGVNLVQRLEDTNTNLRKLQTQINKSRYLAVQLALNELSYQADRFLGNFMRSRDPALSLAEKNVFLANVEDAKKIMPSLLSDIRANLTSEFFVKTVSIDHQSTDEELRQQAEFDLKSALAYDRKALGPNPTNAEDIQNAKLFDQTLKLVGNRGLLGTLQNISIDNFQRSLDAYVQDYDLQKDQQLRKTLDSVLASSKSQLAVIADVKRNRITWSQIVQQIETVTTKTDPVFGKPLLSPDKNIVYNGYEFDAATQKIVLSGTTTTRDGKNFTLMSDLMSQLEQSPYFSDTEMRSFSKTKDIGEGGVPNYVANFKIDLRLESGDLADQKITLNFTQGTDAGVKR